MKFLSKSLIVGGMIFAAAGLVGCGNTTGFGNNNVDTENIALHMDTDIREMIDKNYEPEAIWYTVEEDGSTVTYVVSEDAIVNEFLDCFKSLEVAAVELALLEPEETKITFCAIERDSNGMAYNCDVTFYDGYVRDGATYYAIMGNDSWTEVKDKIKTSGIKTYYSEATVTIMNELNGFWMGEGLEVSFCQADSGLFYFNIFNHGSTEYTDGDNVQITSLEVNGNDYLVKGIDRNGNDCEYEFMHGKSSIQFGGESLEQMMLE